MAVKEISIKIDNRFMTIEQDECFVLMRVCDIKRIPDYDHPIIRSFKRSINRKTKIVLCIIHSIDSKIFQYRYKEGIFFYKVPKSEFIYKMPNSPLHTFIIVNLRNLGIIEVLSKKNRVLFTLDLNAVIRDIQKLDLSLDKYNRINFTRMPHCVFGK